MATERQPPLVLALLLADNGHRDSITGKYFVLGTVSAVQAPAFPGSVPMLCVYAALTDGRGDTQLKIVLVDVDEKRKPLFEVDTVVHFPDPFYVAEIMFLFPGLTFPAPDEYRVQLHAAGQLVCERRLLVEQAEHPGHA